MPVDAATAPGRVSSRGTRRCAPTSSGRSSRSRCRSWSASAACPSRSTTGATLDPEQQAAALEALLAADRARGCDLGRPPLQRLAVVRLGRASASRDLELPPHPAGRLVGLSRLEGRLRRVRGAAAGAGSRAAARSGLTRTSSCGCAGRICGARGSSGARSSPASPCPTSLQDAVATPGADVA